MYYVRGFTKFGIKVLWRLQFLEYLRTFSIKFQKARTKIEIVLSLPCWLSQFSWAFWNFKCQVLKYSKTCSLHNTLIPNFVKLLNFSYLIISFSKCYCRLWSEFWLELLKNYFAVFFSHIISTEREENCQLVECSHFSKRAQI